MSAHWVTNEIAVTPRTEPLLDNGETGDRRVTLWVGDVLERRDGYPLVPGEVVVYLETNGGPRLIEDAVRDNSCTIAQAAEALGETATELVATVRREVPAIDWGDPSDEARGA